MRMGLKRRRLRVKAPKRMIEGETVNTQNLIVRVRRTFDTLKIQPNFCCVAATDDTETVVGWRSDVDDQGFGVAGSIPTILDEPLFSLTADHERVFLRLGYNGAQTADERATIWLSYIYDDSINILASWDSDLKAYVYGQLGDSPSKAVTHMWNRLNTELCVRIKAYPATTALYSDFYILKGTA